MFNQFKVGQLVKITGDSFEKDQHGYAEGTVGVIEELVPATDYVDLPEDVKLLFTMVGLEGINLPARLHLTIIDEDGYPSPFEFANVLPTDVEKVTVVEEGTEVRLLEDDLMDGFTTGDVVTIEQRDDELGFIDNDGDFRLITQYEFEVVE